MGFELVKELYQLSRLDAGQFGDPAMGLLQALAQFAQDRQAEIWVLADQGDERGAIEREHARWLEGKCRCAVCATIKEAYFAKVVVAIKGGYPRYGAGFAFTFDTDLPSYNDVQRATRLTLINDPLIGSGFLFFADGSQNPQLFNGKLLKEGHFFQEDHALNRREAW